MSDTNKKEIIGCENLIKIYKTEDIEVVALQGLDLTVTEGEMMAIIGNSGSGKSTLLNMIGGLDKPTAGKLFVDGKDLFKLTEKQMVIYKRETVGFVWQNNARNLIPYLSAKENIDLVLKLNSPKKKNRNSMELLEMVGMAHRKDSVLAQLSGGEQQRIAIAIALSANPRILLADEPTGSVDTKTSAQILDLFRKVNQEMNITVVIVTHDRSVARKVDRVVSIRDGRTSSEMIRKISYADELAQIASGISIENDGDEETHIEYAVLDRTGRLQLPAEYLAQLNIKGSNKMRVEMESGRIVLYPPQ